MNHKSSKYYDVIIVGAGPAGSTAGYLLSKSGLSVLIIDKYTFPRKKLCAGLITFKTVKLLERIFGETVQSLKDKDIINFESSHYKVFRKNKLITQRDISTPFRFIDRFSYDHFLLLKAKQVGAEVLEGEKIISFDLSMSTVTTSTNHQFRGRIILGADGVNSIIRRSLPKEQFDRQSWYNNSAAALEIFVSRSEIKRQINHPSLFFDYINWGYAWVFPNRDRIIIGLCGLNKANKKKFLSSFNNFVTAIDLFDFSKAEISGHLVPYGSYILNPVFKNIILVGDAAGFADPLLGEGIFYAQRSAELASQAILETLRETKHSETTQEQISRNYLQSLQKYIYPEFIYAEKIRYFAFKYLNRLGYYPLKILMAILGNKPVEAVHGIRSYKWMKIKKYDRV
jgi:geranylgeranyl reductase family protein